MSMIVAVEENVSTILRFPHHNFGCIVFGTNLRTGSDPLPIQVKATQTASVVPNYHTIWIEHWYYFEDKIIA